jgi:predicted transcriptional regulator
MRQLTIHRNVLGISQSKLARLSGVSRFKICTFELGGGALSPEDQERIKIALEGEAARLRTVASTVKFSGPESTEGA